MTTSSIRPSLGERRQRQDRCGRIAAGVGDELGIADRLAVQLGQPVDGVGEQLGRAVSRRTTSHRAAVVEAEVRGEVDHRHAEAAQLGLGALGGGPLRGLPPRATSPPTSTGTGGTARRSCSASAVYGLPELHRGLRGAGWSPTRAATRPPAMLALAPLAEQGLIDDVVIDAEVRRLRRRAGRRRGDALRRRGRERQALRGRRPPPLPEIAQELRRALGAEGEVTFVPHLLPIDQGLLASCFVHPGARGRRRGARALRRALRQASASSR